MALPLDGANKGKNGSSFGRWNRAHWKVVTAVVLVVVLLVLAIVSSIASLIMVLMEDDEDASAYTQTILHVRASNMSLTTGKKEAVPNLEISLVQKEPPKDKNGKKQDPQQIGFPTTDKKGEAQTVLSTVGNGAFTYTDGLSLTSDGRPTEYVDVIKGKSYHTTFYDNSSVSYGSQGTDTGQSDFSYNLDNSRPAGIKMCAGKIRPTKEANSPSDTWHIVGVIKANREGLKKMFFDGSNDGVRAKYGGGYGHYGSYVYVYNEDNPSCSYGTAVAADVGGGMDSNTIGDLWMPAYKYYGIKGLKGTGVESATVRKGQKNAWVQYFASKGISYPKDMNNPHSTIYILDHGQKGSRGYQLLQAMEDNKPWIYGGGSSSLGNTKDNDKYVINFKGKHGNDLIRTPMELSKVYTDESNPYTVTEEGARALFRGTMIFEFWTTTETVGAGNGSLTGDFSDWNKVDNKNFCSSRGGGGINPYMLRSGKPGNEHCNALPNCVAYAWGILKQHGVNLGHYGNPSNWISGAKADGFTVSTNKNAPKVGAVAVFQSHVAVVASVDSSSECTLIESDYAKGPSAKAYPYCRVQHGWKNGSNIGGRFLGYIYTSK